MKFGDKVLASSIRVEDVAAIRRAVEGHQESEFARERDSRNVNGPPPNFSRDQFWYVLTGCLLTTRQRVKKGSPVDLLLSAQPFPLALVACGKCAHVEPFVQKTIKEYSGIRFGITISRRMAENLKRMNAGRWQEAQDWFERLRSQRARQPQPGDKVIEREAARWADANLAGLGPKQSRNLWQWLGLSRYEIPLDSRVTDWINDNFSIQVQSNRLGLSEYYESVVDYIQAACERAGVLPCMLDAAAFDFEDSRRAWSRKDRGTTQPGFVNRQGQITIRSTGLPGTDHLQYVYQLACSHCGQTYGANGSDIHERKCPVCQSGRPGIPL